MINKYLLIVVIFLIMINISCKNEKNLKPINNVNLTAIKDYAFITEYSMDTSSFTLDPEGNIYLIDTHRTHTKNTTEKSVTESGWDYCVGGFYTMAGCPTPNPDDMCYISKFDSQGNFITKWPCEDRNIINKITVCNQNIYVIAEISGCRHVLIYDLNGKFITKVEPNDFVGSVTGDKEGNIYLAKSNKIEKYDSKGLFKFMFNPFEKNPCLQGVHPGIIDIKIDSSGYIYISTYNNVIAKYDSSGKFITKWMPGVKNASCWRMGIDSCDNIYVCDNIYELNQEEPCYIEKFDSNGTFITKFGFEGNKEERLSNPGEVSVDSMGNVYVLDYIICDYIHYTPHIKKYAPVLNKSK